MKRCYSLALVAGLSTEQGQQLCLSLIPLYICPSALDSPVQHGGPMLQIPWHESHRAIKGRDPLKSRRCHSDSKVIVAIAINVPPLLLCCLWPVTCTLSLFGDLESPAHEPNHENKMGAPRACGCSLVAVFSQLDFLWIL